MGLALQVLVIYAFTCMVFATVVVIRGFDKAVESVPSGTGFDLLMVGMILVILTSPFWIPRVVVRTIRTLWQKVRDECQLLEEDQP